MNKTQLAKSLGISRSRLYQCIELGCPTDSLSSAQAWRDRNIDFTMTDAYRPGGNTGGKRKKQPVDDSIRRTAHHILAKWMLREYFDQPGWLGLALKDAGIDITAQQLLKVQSGLMVLYMGLVDEYLEEDTTFTVGDIMMINEEDEAYPSLIESLNKILEN